MDERSAVARLAALAQETRLGIFRLLVQQGPAGLAAGAIGERLGIVANTLSFHLAALSHAGLVRSTRNGRSLVYAADFERMQELLSYLMENCCRGSACAPPAASPASRGRSRAKKITKG